MENTVSRYQFQGPILWNCLNSRFQIGKPLRNSLIYLLPYEVPQYGRPCSSRWRRQSHCLPRPTQRSPYSRIHPTPNPSPRQKNGLPRQSHGRPRNGSTSLQFQHQVPRLLRPHRPPDDQSSRRTKSHLSLSPTRIRKPRDHTRLPGRPLLGRRSPSPGKPQVARRPPSPRHPRSRFPRTSLQSHSSQLDRIYHLPPGLRRPRHPPLIPRHPLLLQRPVHHLLRCRSPTPRAREKTPSPYPLPSHRLPPRGPILRRLPPISNVHGRTPFQNRRTHLVVSTRRSILLPRMVRPNQTRLPPHHPPRNRSMAQELKNSPTRPRPPRLGPLHDRMGGHEPEQ